MAARFVVAIFLAAIFSGATASLVGFGIGSLLTPLLALQLGMDVAVAAVIALVLFALLALVTDGLLDALDISAASFRIAAGLVVGIGGLHALLVRPVPWPERRPGG